LGNKKRTLSLHKPVVHLIAVGLLCICGPIDGFNLRRWEIKVAPPESRRVKITHSGKVRLTPVLPSHPIGLSLWHTRLPLFSDSLVEFDRLVSRFEYKSSRLKYWQLGSDSYCGPLSEVDHR
jgi:hypothetical protein